MDDLTYLKYIINQKETISNRKVINDIKEKMKTKINYLLESKDYEYASRICRWIYLPNSKIWDFWIESFIREKQFSVLYSIIPIGTDISKASYMKLLLGLIEPEPKLFLELLQKLPIDRYDPNLLLNELTRGRDKIPALLEGKAYLNLKIAKYDTALDLYLKSTSVNSNVI